MLRQAHTAALLVCLFGAALGACLATPESPKSKKTAQHEDTGACDSPSSPRKRPIPSAHPLDDTLDVRIAREPASLLPEVDPSLACRSVVLHQVLETLVRRTGSTAQYGPELAAAFEISEDRLTYIFHIDPSAAWSDGHPVVAGDVVHTLRRLIDPTEVLLPRLAPLGVSEVEALDEGTVLVRLLAPSDELLPVLSQVAILPRHVFEMTEVSSTPQARRPIGSGPYTVEAWIPGQRISLRRNAAWRGPMPDFETVVYHFVPDDRVATDLFESGGLDVVTGMQRLPWRGDLWPQPYIYDVPETAVLVYNAGRPATADPVVRRSLADIIDRSAVRCQVLDGLSRPVTTAWPGLPLPPLPPVRRDSQAVANRLAAAGWNLSSESGVRHRAGVPLRPTLLFSDEPGGFDRASVLIVQDAATVGIDLRFERLGRRSLLARLSQRDFDIAAVSVSDDWLANAERFLSPGGQAEGLGIDIHDLELRTLLQGLAQTRDSAQKDSIARDLTQRITQLEPVTFLYGRREAALVHPDLAEPVFDRGRLDIALARPRDRMTSR